MMPRLSTFLLVLLTPLAAMAEPRSYNINVFHSYPNFTVNYLGLLPITGRFDKMSGKIMLDQTAKSGSVEVKIATASVTTGDAKRADGARSRDDHLRSADFFNSTEFPEMVYKSTKFNFNGEALESVEGNLTLLGVTKPVKLQASSFKCGPHPFSKNPVCGALLETTIKRTDFGMKYAVPAIADDIKLAIGILADQE